MFPHVWTLDFPLLSLSRSLGTLSKTFIAEMKNPKKKKANKYIVELAKIL
jgi:hypothetical protein